MSGSCFALPFAALTMPMMLMMKNARLKAEQRDYQSGEQTETDKTEYHAYNRADYRIRYAPDDLRYREHKSLICVETGIFRVRSREYRNEHKPGQIRKYCHYAVLFDISRVELSG